MIHQSNSKMQMYSVSTNFGSQLYNELTRIEAITGNRPQVAQVVGDNRKKLGKIQTYLSKDLLVYVLGYGRLTSVTLMTRESYELVRRPDVRVIRQWTVKEVIDTVADLANPVSLSNASSREGLRAVFPDEDIIDLATQMKEWIDNIGSGLPGSDPALAFGGGFVLENMNPKVLLTLAGYAGHIEYFDTTWAIHNYSAWEEFRALANDDMAARDVQFRLSL